MQKIKLITALIISFVIGYFSHTDSNAKLEYGTTGFPKNCRAIIYENYEGYWINDYTAKEALESINRNCGKNGLSWDE